MANYKSLLNDVDEVLMKNEYFIPSRLDSLPGPDMKLKFDAENPEILKEIFNNNYFDKKYDFEIKQPDTTIQESQNEDNIKNIEQFDYKKVDSQDEEDNFKKLQRDHLILYNKYQKVLIQRNLFISYILKSKHLLEFTEKEIVDKINKQQITEPLKTELIKVIKNRDNNINRIFSRIVENKILDPRIKNDLLIDLSDRLEALDEGNQRN